GYSEKYKEQLIEIAAMLYKPTNIKEVPRHDTENWYDVGFCGGMIPCSPETSNFIKSINSQNIAAFKKHREEMISRVLAEKNANETIDFISDTIISKEKHFYEIFNLGWESLDSENHEIGWKLLYKLLERASEKLIRQFFDDWDTTKFDDIENKRFKHLKEVFEENEYYRRQAEEAQRRYYEEQFEMQN
ncbi:MAG: hypothetical protein LRY73_14925, partial [Bacillus sp. (in: Bacteria)]|nr:hypothetical protein [Bacillus sp. (in: firmicutes)]